jgi:hypothetical protein
VILVSSTRQHRRQRSHGMTGTVDRLLKEEPSTTFVLYARETSVRRARSTIRTTRICLKSIEVRSPNTSASLGNLARSTVMGPTCRQAIENRERSSATPTRPFTPPVRACERWHVTPGKPRHDILYASAELSRLTGDRICWQRIMMHKLPYSPPYICLDSRTFQVGEESSIGNIHET